jgi:subtilisin family serine protease
MRCSAAAPWSSPTGLTGNGVSVAVVDSGVFAAHPHVGRVAGGIALRPDGAASRDVLDRLGHGTAVAAAIREKAPDASLQAVKIFDRTLSAGLDQLVQAIDWAVAEGADLINLSLGTRAGGEALTRAVDAAVRAGVLIVAARADDRGPWFPGSLPGVLAVDVDWTCPRDEFRAAGSDGRGVTLRASGYPRPIPGVPPERNLKGVSFAVANVTGIAARARQALPSASPAALARALADSAVHPFG